ncbi:hypothetical protein N7456_003851 [Penicillium angulare]|uniref:Major facilitator superfamily (MFS) profile domain-containing protein n=1 Tax=Penicillium angulare TaxID=116970 RepID=A0A9W9KIM9_9EURO|nr:hypothetical protein N7456_003851 [Penicillium angulare]
MGLKALLSRSAIATYGRNIKSAPREVILNPSLLISALMYASTAIPLTWDQGSASTITSLTGFQSHFGVSSGSDPSAVKNIVSLVYIGDAIGAALSYFINDRVGRFRMDYRAAGRRSKSHVSAARIISGLGIGALGVTGPMSIVEIAPKEIRGLLTSWYSVSMMIALLLSTFCVYGVELHIAPSNLQYQVVWFSPCVFMFLWVVASFFLCESPRWLVMSDRSENALETLVRLRGLQVDHPRINEEIHDITESINLENEVSEFDHASSFKIVRDFKETFTVPANLRRAQQALILYAFPQVSGGNSMTNYFIPILGILGLSGDSSRNLFLNGMYALSKLFFALFTSFFFIDVLGRRKSLFTGITMQMISILYLAVYLKFQQEGRASHAAGEAALASIFTFAFGYTTGLLTLPYVFGGELWPNRIRSFGAALSSTFHWLFHYAMTYGLPSLLARTNNWGAFIFFAAWCLVALLYVYLLVPEIAGYSVEEIDRIFSGPWVVNRMPWRKSQPSVLEGQDSDDGLKLTEY